MDAMQNIVSKLKLSLSFNIYGIIECLIFQYLLNNRSQLSR